MEQGSSLLYLILIITAAKIGGEIAEHFRQPAVLGELLAGVILAATPLRAAAGNEAIAFIASIGIILLLFEVGLESELTEFVKVGKSALLAALIGVLLPFASGFGVIFAITRDLGLALFMGAALTATSVGITARVLSDLGRMESQEAKVILGAAVIDDILGLLVLSIVLQIIANGRASVLDISKAVGIAVAFLVLAIWVGTRFAHLLVALAGRLHTRGVLISTAFVFGLALALAADELGLAEIIGAFAAGLVLARTDRRTHIQRQIAPVANIFIPVFFVLVGLQLNLGQINLFDPAGRVMLLASLGLLVLAVLGKLASGWGVVKRGINRLSVGIGMVPRGEVGLIFASIGLQQGILAQDLYAGLLIIVFVTTLITPPWLKKVLGQGTDHPAEVPELE